MRLLSQSSIYLASSLLSKAAPFLLLPIMTRYLSPAQFGALSLFMLINGCVGAFVGMNIHSNISKNFFSLSRLQLSELIGNILVIMLGVAAFLTVMFLGMSFFMSSAFSLPMTLFMIMPVLSFLMMVNTINLTILRNEQRAIVYGIFEVSSTFLIFSVTVSLLVFADAGWYAQIISLVVTYGVFFVVAVIYMRQRGYLRFNILFAELGRVLRQSSPMIPYVLAGIVMAISDRVFIERMVGLEAVGHYAIGYNFGMVVLVFADAFNKAWAPWFYKRMQVPLHENKVQVVRYTYMYLVFILLLALLVAAISHAILPWLVTESFYDSGRYVLWIALAFAMQGVYKMLFPYFILLDRNHALAVLLVCAALFNLIFNYFLIAEFGAIGAAYSSVLAWAAAALMAFIYLRRFYIMPWGLRDEKNH